MTTRMARRSASGALAIWEKALGTGHPHTKSVKGNSAPIQSQISWNDSCARNPIGRSYVRQVLQNGWAIAFNLELAIVRPMPLVDVFNDFDRAPV